MIATPTSHKNSNTHGLLSPTPIYSGELRGLYNFQPEAAHRSRSAVCICEGARLVRICLGAVFLMLTHAQSCIDMAANTQPGYP